MNNFWEVQGLHTGVKGKWIGAVFGSEGYPQGLLGTNNDVFVVEIHDDDSGAVTRRNFGKQ